MIVSMKQHAPGVAKVVNPLGTVVTVQLDDDAPEVDGGRPEDAVIHENRDEALFRPVVAPKSLHYADSKSRMLGDKVYKRLITDDIHTRNLKSTTEVAFKVPSRNERGPDKNGKTKRVKEPPSKNERNRRSSQVDPEALFNNRQNNKTESVDGAVVHSHKNKVSNAKPVVNVSIADSSQKPDLILSKEPESLDDLVARKAPEPADALKEWKIPPLLSDSIFKIDHFEDAREFCGEILEGRPEKPERDAHSSSEENVVEEKAVSKKPRKPKAKLGVRIANPPKADEDRTEPDESIEVFLSAPPKKSWSAVAARKPAAEPEEPTKDASLIDVSDGDFVTCSDGNVSGRKYKSELKFAFDDLEASKTERSSDDEKVSGSQTESDDSAKVRAAAADGDDGQVNVVASSDSQTKSAKRKSKKKKK